MSPKASKEMGGGGPGFYFWLWVELLKFGFVPEFVDNLSSLVTKGVVYLNDVFFMGQ
jgi:hypothetical protein